MCLFLYLSDCAADGNGYFMYADFWCAVYSREQAQVEYLVDWYFNKEFMMQYNSTVGNWTGFTPAGLNTASMLNGDKYDILQRKIERQLICVNNVGLVLNITEENRGKYSNTDYMIYIQSCVCVLSRYRGAVRIQKYTYQQL